MHRLGYAFTLLVAVGFGGVVAVIGAFWQVGTVLIGSVLVPMGLGGALLITWAGARVISSLTVGRAGAVAMAVGWLIGAFALTSNTAAGDLVVPGTWYGYAFLGGGLVIVTGVALMAAPLVPAASGRVRASR